jgi:hypothetical protein
VIQDYHDVLADYAVGVYAQDLNMVDRGANMPTFLQQAGVFQRFGPLFG